MENQERMSTLTEHADVFSRRNQLILKNSIASDLFFPRPEIRRNTVDLPHPEGSTKHMNPFVWMLVPVLATGAAAAPFS